MSVGIEFDDEEVLNRTTVGSEIGDPMTVRASGRGFTGTVSGIEETIEAALSEIINSNEN